MNPLAEAHQRAEALEATLSAGLKALKLEKPRKVFYKVQNYLVEQCRQHSATNDIHSKIKFQAPDAAGIALILLGPTFDKGPSEEHVNLDSGARLSFGITLREGPDGAELVSFRFHLQFAEASSPPFLRFDLNKNSHPTPLGEPRCHLHPGIEDVRLPSPVLSPIEILDRIFLTIEPEFAKK